MHLSLNWLSQFVDIKDLDPEDISRKLTLHTAEIEGLEIKGADLANILTGKISRLTHLDDKYDLLEVDMGKSCRIVCTDKTLAEGEMICLASPGITLNGRVVEARKIAGHISEGFLMSEKDMGISDYEQTVFRVEHPDAKPGKSILELYPFFHDVILELDNKSVTHRPDLWGIYGFAREMAAIYKRPLKSLPVKPAEEINQSKTSGPSIRILAKDHCPRYASVTISGIQKQQTPLEMRTLLYYSGHKPISLLVDISNYIMAEIGQPTHTFDRREVSTGIIVDYVQEPMPFPILDGSEPVMPKGAMMIYNGDKIPVAVAGIMGGEKSKILDDTTEILLESANFDAKSVRTTSSAIKTRTDASNRYEKTLVPRQTIVAIERFVYILGQIQPGILYSQITDIDHSDSSTRTISLSESFVSSFTGANFSRELISDILNRLGFVHEYVNGNFEVTVPWYRSKKDINNQPDLVEEIARIYGYDNIIPEPPKIGIAPLNENKVVKADLELKRVLSYEFGFNEVRTYGWDDSRWLETVEIEPYNAVTLANPRAPYFNKLKTSLIPALLQHIKTNMANFSRVAIYEIESTFFENQGKPSEKKSLAGLSFDKNRSEENLFFQVKDAITYAFSSLKNRYLRFEYGASEPGKTWITPNKSLSFYYENVYLGYISVLQPRLAKTQFGNYPVVVFEFDIEAFTKVSPRVHSFIRPNPFPFVSLDFNIIADKQIRYNEVVAVITTMENGFMKDFSFKELFQDEKILPGKNSFLFTITIGSEEKTLNAEEINEFKGQMIAHLENKGLAIR
ncbi:MAG: phenylalanine--tRNA ligase subunit beta [Bacteroidia bacterium]|nr:phenylalanine--tRNA ligase subunit beta [Bacteroidia bacterium]